MSTGSTNIAAITVAPADLHTDGDTDAEKAVPELSRTVSGVYSVFTDTQKRLIILLVSIASFFSPFSSNIYFPALSVLAHDLKVSNELINLTITSYMVFQALSPMIFGGLADVMGRRPVYILLFAIYLSANIGLALQRAYPALLVLRMLQSTGSSGVIALGMGVVADITHAGERGVFMGVMSAGAMCGPAVGPVVGGLLTNKLGWWWIFYLLTIMSAVFLVVLVLFFPETGRNVVGNGSLPTRAMNTSVITLLRRRRSNAAPDILPPPPQKLSFPNPIASIRLIFEKDMAIVLFAYSILYTGLWMVMASLPSLFDEIYAYDSLQVGLCYLPFGVGCALSSVGTGKIINRDYRVVARECGIEMDKKKGEDMSKFPVEKARLRTIFWTLALYSAVLIAYGWVLHLETSLAVPLVLQFLIGIFGTSILSTLNTLIVDMYPLKPSSATACNNLVRCIMGAGGTAVIQSMLNTMGRGWCFTFVGLVCTLATPLLLVERKYGTGWRVERGERQAS